MERYQEALEYLKKAAIINEQDVMVHVHLSVVYQRVKSPKKAQGELDKARSLTSDPHELKHIEEELELVSGHDHHHTHDRETMSMSTTCCNRSVLEPTHKAFRCPSEHFTPSRL